MGRGVRREFAQAPHVADQSPTQSAHFSVSRPHRSIVEARDVIKFAFHPGESDGVTGGLSLLNQAVKLFLALYKLYIERDCSLVEVNPLAVTTDGKLVALDAKFNFDDSALYRQKEVAALRDTSEEDSREVAASEFGLNYIGLDGNIACLVNGAGLAMSTVDIIK